MGQSLTLQCSGTTVRGITSRVDIVWRHSDTIINTTRVTATAIGNLLVFRDYYTISQLSTSDDGVMYECRVVIHVDPRVRVTDSVSLDVIGKYFTET